MLALIDLLAAVDTIDHAKLIHLLENKCGVRGTALKWFPPYLSGRYFQVNVGDIRSDPCPLVCGVPQGLVLGPVIFNLYTRPLSQIINCCNLQHHKYADDVQIYDSCHPTPADSACIVSEVQDCLEQVRAWILSSMLKINDLKTELIIFTNPQQAKLQPDLGLTSVTFAGTTSNMSTAVHDLGAVLDCQLVRGAHVSVVVKSCNFHLYQLSCMRHFITDEACKLAMHVLVMLQLDFCSSLLVGTSEKSLDKLQKLQNWAACLVARPCGAWGQVIHVSPILQQLHWLPIRQQIQFKTCVFVFNCLHGDAPSYLMGLLYLRM